MRRMGPTRPQPAPMSRSFQCLVLAFQLLLVVATASQQAASEQQQQQNPSQAAHHDQAGSQPPMMSMGSESSSALESSAALAGDDLMAAESSQSPESAANEHGKAFTSAQVLRADQQQMAAASVAPVYSAPPAQPHFNPQQHHPQHMAALQARLHSQQKPAFNPFMAAALAGNYGPAQQQIAAAAAANMQHQAHGPHHGPHQVHPQMVPPIHHQAAMHHGQQQQVASHPQQMIHPQQQQQAASMINPQQVRPAQDPVAVQESLVRSNVLPAPGQFASMVDTNSIELNDQAAGSQMMQAKPVASIQSAGQQMSAAASVPHPVITSASTAMQESGAQAWPLQAPDVPKIVNLEVKCEKNLMKVSIEFDKVFNGVVFSKGHYSQNQCVHVTQNSGKQQAYFDIGINNCGTQGNTQNGLYGMGGNTGSGTYFENTIVIQYDPNVQEVYDHARKLRCTWHDQYEKAVTFRPFPVDMLDIVRADFAGDNVGCWMQIQVGKGPWASEVAGIVKIGQTMTMVLAIKDEENKFDMLVRNCFAHDGKRGPIELVDKSGCITRPKLMSRFTKIKNFGSSATVLSYAHFQAFKFPDSMEVHFQCTIQICRHQCPEQCSANGANQIGGSGGESYSESTISGTLNMGGASASSDSVHLRKYGSQASASSRAKRDVWGGSSGNGSHPFRPFQVKPLTQTVGLNRVIQVVSASDLAYAIAQQQQQVNGTERLGDAMGSAQALTRVDLSNQICMSSYNFVLSLVVLALILLCSFLAAISLYMRQRSLRMSGLGGAKAAKLLVPSTCSSPSSASSSSSQSSSLRQLQQVPCQQQQQQLYTNQETAHHHNFHHLYRQ